MKFYEQFLKDQGLQVQYIESIKAQNKIELVLEKLYSSKIKKIHIVDPVDNWLLYKIKSGCKKYKMELTIYDNPNFLNSINDVDAYFSKKKTYFQTDLLMR
jgi:deoxyribodipyrimidine photolyase-related protein